MIQNDRKHTQQSTSGSKATLQIIWGTALVLAGVGVFYRIPQVMKKVMLIEQFVSSALIIRFCFYLLGVLLIGGGGKKIYDHFNRT